LTPAWRLFNDFRAELTPEALVPRFISMLVLAERAADIPRAMLEGLRAAPPAPLEANRAYADCFVGMGESAGALTHDLAYLQIDLTEPEFHPHARTLVATMQEAIRGPTAASCRLRALGKHCPRIVPDRANNSPGCCVCKVAGRDDGLGREFGPESC
jgi:hypothetical protein